MSEMNTLAIVIADDYRSMPLSVLSQERARAAMPFAGKYRIVDFALSNCANSGILAVGILAQHHPRSLSDYIRAGQPWDLDRNFSGGVTVLQPYQRWVGSLEWYHGTADAVYQNLDFILRHKVDTVLVLSSDCIHKMDYTPLIRYHQQCQADVTVCAIDVPLEKASRFSTMVTDSSDRVTEFQEESRFTLGTRVYINRYFFRTEVRVARLSQ